MSDLKDLKQFLGNLSDKHGGQMTWVDYGITPDGRWVWKCDARNAYGGPFATKAEAQKHSEITLLGPQYKINEGGEWDPAWDRPQ
jgi:hypothetical protein